MALYVFKVTTPYAVDPTPVYSADPRQSCLNAAKVVRDVAAGYVGTASLTADMAAVQAAGTVTFAALAADDTVTVGGETFTAKVSPSGANQFALGADDTAAAAAFVAKVNAHANLAGVVTGTSALGVSTLTATTGGLSGNAIALTSSNGTRAAVTAFTGGTATSVTVSF